MSLLQKLTDLGDDLIAGEIPAGHEVPKVVAGLIHWLETGSLEAPERLPSEAVQRELSEDKAEIERLRAAVESLQAERTQAPAAPAVPVPPTPAPAPPAAEPPPPVAAVPPPSPVPPAGGQAVPPPVAPVPPVPEPPAPQQV